MHDDTREVLDQFRLGMEGIDDKLAVMGNLVTQIAIVQERMVVLQEKHTRSEEDVANLRVQIDVLKTESRTQEKLIEDNRRTVAVIHKTAGAVLLGLIGATAKLLLGV